MGLDSTSQVAQVLGNLIKEQRSSSEAIPDEVSSEFLLAPFEQVKVTVEVTGTKNTYANDSFILDHPIQGELDSSTYKLDGGYDGSPTIIFTYNS